MGDVYQATDTKLAAVWQSKTEVAGNLKVQQII
jgi:hypothetical protein